MFSSQVSGSLSGCKSSDLEEEVMPDDQEYRSRYVANCGSVWRQGSAASAGSASSHFGRQAAINGYTVVRRKAQGGFGRKVPLDKRICCAVGLHVSEEYRSHESICRAKSDTEQPRRLQQSRKRRERQKLRPRTPARVAILGRLPPNTSVVRHSAQRPQADNPENGFGLRLPERVSTAAPTPVTIIMMVDPGALKRAYSYTYIHTLGLPCVMQHHVALRQCKGLGVSWRPVILPVTRIPHAWRSLARKSTQKLADSSRKRVATPIIVSHTYNLVAEGKTIAGSEGPTGYSYTCPGKFKI
ncbi:hypothetical protein FGB62_237g05 [Gracilaria domingensis]|nr:hypothetical protein FGB62_237g05 [Gracilaria domingensis]